MFFKPIFAFLLFLNLHAAETLMLEDSYFVESREINASIITNDTRNDFLLLQIPQESYTKKMKTKELLALLSEHGYKKFDSKRSYINFTLKSPIDTSFMEAKVREHYEKSYKNIEIEKILITPRSFMQTLPKEYTVHLKNRDFLSNSGVLHIKTSDNKKLFFDYEIKAYLSVFISKESIEKEYKISPINYMPKKILLDKFRDRPLQSLEQTSMQAKRRIPKDTILTIRDVELLDLVKKDSTITVSMSSEGMNILFSAKALQDGKLDDIIKIQNSSQKILKARVTGLETAELE